MEQILSINNISKQYGPVQALKNVSFNVPKGCVFGVLGPNGSGKTTMLGIILNVLNADAGTYQWLNGVPEATARKNIGSLLETPNFYHYMSATDNLKIAAKIKDKPHADIDTALRKVGLWERRDSKFNTYSLGMKQRLAIASALLGDPDILLFDEPTNGLDPAGIAEIRDLIIELNREGKTIIMASHLLQEVERVCTHVAILKKGDLLVDGPVDEVLVNEKQIEVGSADLTTLEQSLSKLAGVHNIKHVNGALLLNCDDALTTTTLNEHCIKDGITLAHLVLKKKSLETKFIELTKQ